MTESALHIELKQKLADLMANGDTEVNTWGNRRLDAANSMIAAEVQVKGNLEHAIESLEGAEQEVKILMVALENDFDEAIELAKNSTEIIFVVDGDFNVLYDPT